MAKYASSVVKQAQAWLGRKEGSSGHKEIVDIYNAHKPLARGYKVKYTDAWCATFVSAIAIKLGYTDIIPTECGCGKMIELFKKLGAWVENENVTPKLGWILFYDWQDNGKGDNTGSPDHVGVVVKVENGNIHVAEGNYNVNGIDSVGIRVIPINARYLRGYGAPKYDAETTPKKEEKELTKAEIEKLIDEKIKASQEKVYHYWKELPSWAYAPVKALYDRKVFRGASSADLNLKQTKMECLVVIAEELKKEGLINY